MVLVTNSIPALQFHIKDVNPSECCIRAVMGGKPFFNAIVPNSNPAPAIYSAIENHCLSQTKIQLIHTNLDSIVSAINNESDFSHKSIPSN